MGYVYSDVAQERKHLQDPENLTEVTVGNQENMVERLTKANVAQSIQTLKKETRGGRRRGQRRNSGSRAQAKSQRLSHHHPLPQSCRRQGWRQILNARIMKVIGRNSRGRRNRRRRRSREGRSHNRAVGSRRHDIVSSRTHCVFTRTVHASCMSHCSIV